MSDIWNDFDLKPPPLIILKATNAQFARRVNIAINKYKQNNARQSTVFAQTSALLSRLMARRKNSFRHMTGFRAICKLNSAVCRLLRVDFPRELERFQSALPDMNFDDETCAELPTRNNVDYLLVRLLGVYSIYRRIRECCTEAAEYFTQMIRSNFFIDISTLLLAVFAKLQSLSTSMGNSCVELYSNLIKYQEHFPNQNNYTFLPQTVELPTQLDAFQKPELNIPETNVTTDLERAVPNRITLETKTLTSIVAKPKLDVGTEVTRDAKESQFDISKLATVQDVKQFIDKENKARKQSIKNSITKQILQHEWMGVQKLFERKILANDHEKALNIFRKFICSKMQQ